MLFLFCYFLTCTYLFEDNSIVICTYKLSILCNAGHKFIDWVSLQNAYRMKLKTPLNDIFIYYLFDISGTVGNMSWIAANLN